MKTELYVFSATGNCLTTARKLAQKLEHCNIIPVTAVKNQAKILVEADCVGIVFPVYYGNMPYPVRELVSKMVCKPDTYIFTVTTCRGHVGAANQRMDQLLRTRGQKLSLAVGIRMPGNSFLNTMEQDQECLDQQDACVAEILEPIQNRQIQNHFTEELLPLTPVDYPNNFRGLVAEESCIGCGTCVKVCPMNNITMENGKAHIGDNCATCLACFHWCPVEAICMSKAADIARRRKYRHPDVTLADIAGQKEATKR